MDNCDCISEGESLGAAARAHHEEVAHLPNDLAGPIRVTLARAEESIPNSSTFPGGAIFAPK